MPELCARRRSEAPREHRFSDQLGHAERERGFRRVARIVSPEALAARLAGASIQPSITPALSRGVLPVCKDDAREARATRARSAGYSSAKRGLLEDGGAELGGCAEAPSRIVFADTTSGGRKRGPSAPRLPRASSLPIRPAGAGSGAPERKERTRNASESGRAGDGSRGRLGGPGAHRFGRKGQRCPCGGLGAIADMWTGRRPRPHHVSR
jgi:hypothetical protein